MPSFGHVFLSSRVFHNGTYCVGPDESYVSAYDQNRVVDLVTRRNM